MMNKRLLFAGLIILLAGIVAGVFAAARPTTPLPLLTNTPGPTNTATIVVAAANPTATLTPTSPATPTVTTFAPRITLRPTYTRTPTPVPTVVSPTPTIPVGFPSALTTRQPTLAVLNEYLTHRSFTFFTTDYLSPDPIRSNWWVGSLEALSEQAEIFYVDVNGDEELDLTISERVPPYVTTRGYLFIMLWAEDHYLEPFIVGGSSIYGSPLQRLTFEDWTGDSTPEIVFDQATNRGGTGYLYEVWVKYVVYCESTCSIAWYNQLIFRRQVYTATSYSINYIEHSNDALGHPSISVISEGFSPPLVWEPAISGERSAYHIIRDKTQSTWVWNGAEFLFVNEIVLEKGKEIVSQSVLTATHSSGIQAFITVAPYEDKPEVIIDQCALVISDVAIGEPFVCDSNFTQVFWQDVTNDSHEELVVISYALNEQRLQAYQWDGTNVWLIADVTGTTIESDLYGVRLENLDEDAALEIRVGNIERVSSNCKVYEADSEHPYEDCWYAELVFFDTWYDWNGATYVDRGRVP